MSGTYIADANATNLLAGGTLALDNDATTTTYGAVLEVNWPGFVVFDLTIADPDANDDASITVTIQGCETSDFSTSDVRTMLVYPTIGEAAGNTAAAEQPFQGVTCIDCKYIRAAVSVVDGTNGDYAGSTLYMRPWEYKNVWPRGDSIGNTAIRSLAPLA